MAGLDQTLSRHSVPKTAPNSNAPDSNAPDSEEPSLPLYAAGFIITLCGILGANAALTQPDYGWMTDTLMLSGLGFLFSYGSRRFGITANVLDYGFAGILAIVLACFAAGLLSPEQLMPMGADRPDLRLLSSLVWGGTIWAWALRSDNRVVGTTVPAMAILGMAATIDVNTPVLICFSAFVLTVIFLLIHQNYLQNRLRASRSMDDALPRRLLMAQFALASLCGLVVSLMGLVVIVPAQAVFSNLSLSQAIRHLASIQPSPSTGAAVLHFSDDDNLSIGTGEAWSSSADVVMRVTPSDGQPHYWRGRTYDVYTGDGWQSSLENSTQDVTVGSPAAGDLTGYSLPPSLTPGDPVLPPAAPTLTAAFEVQGDTQQFYYAAAPRQVIFSTMTAHNHSGAQVWHDGRLGLVDGRGIRFPYQVVSSPPPDPTVPGIAALLRQAGTDYPAEVRTLYLGQSSGAQPDDLTFYQQCVAEALQGLPPDRRDPLDEAAALRAWVARRCLYTLTPPPLPDDSDHVHAFLGDTRKGYCDMFASSLAVLCRTAGIPARLAVGFAPGDPAGASFNLRAEDKHAWTEVYFPGAGWVIFDATAGTATDGTVPTSSSGKKSSWLNHLHLDFSGQWALVYPLVFLILGIAAYVAKTELYDLWRTQRRDGVKPVRPKRLLPRRNLSEPYARLLRALARLGLPRRLEETPYEYAARILPDLPGLERDWNVLLSSSLVSGLTQSYTQACYSDPSSPLPPTQPWDSRVTGFEAAVRLLTWRRFWRRAKKSIPRTAHDSRY